MKIYSEKTRLYYDTVKECENAEKAFDKKKEEENKKREELLKQKQELESKRAERFKEVEEAYRKAEDLKRKFLQDYGSIKYTITYKDLQPSQKQFLEHFDNLFEIFDKYTKNFWLI